MHQIVLNIFKLIVYFEAETNYNFEKLKYYISNITYYVYINHIYPKEVNRHV